MIKLHEKTNGSIIATKKVDKKTVSRWGILSVQNKKKISFKLRMSSKNRVKKKHHQIMQLLEDIFYLIKSLTKSKKLNLVWVEKYILLTQ